MSDEIKIIGEWLLIKPDEEEKEIGGIIIPDTARQEIVKGTVCFANDEKGDKNIKVGDLVLYKRRNYVKSQMIEINGQTYLKMRKNQVLGVMFGDNSEDIAPTRNYVFIRWEIAPDEYSKSGLIRPEAFKKMHYTGIAVSVGPDVEEVKAGDRVFFDQFPEDRGIEKFEEDGNRYTIIREEDVIATNLKVREEVNA